MAILRLGSLSLLALIPALFTGCAHQQGASANDPLPVRRVVLYQNGIGYFERAGILYGDTLRLAVRPDQINDLLSSLTVIDRAGGRSQSISLPIDKSAAERLDELPPQVRNKGGLLSLLKAFKGARIAVSMSDQLGELEGRVVGVESLQKQAYLALAHEGTISNLELTKLRRIKLLDRPLQVGLAKVLDHSLNQGKWKPVELTVRFDKNKRHDLVVSYIAEMPTWKPAYRLVLGQPGQGALLQGWAVIDNTSGEDWRGVKLSLSSGAPISFRYDLHRPHFVTRPSVGVKHGGVNAPVAHAKSGMLNSEIMMGGVGGLGGLGQFGGGGSRGSKSASSYGLKREKKKSKRQHFEEEKEPESAFSGMDSFSLDQLAKAQGGSAAGEAVRGLVRYDIAGLVTVPDRSSTLVNLVNRKIEGEDLLLYRPEAGGAAQRHPYRAVRFKNDTGTLLQGGPVTVLARGTFVGSGVFDRLEDGAESFLPFSMEQGVSIRHEGKTSEAAVRLLAISDGKIRCETQSRRSQVFHIIRHAKDAPSTLYLRIAKRPGWSLEKPPKGTRELADSWYVPTPIAEGKTEFKITDVRNHPRQVSWRSNIGQQVLALYLGGNASEELRAAVAKVDTLQKALAKLHRETTEITKKVSGLEREQRRLARNIKTL
ncbi:MAG: hypothetical protein OSB21_11700, partial [Myxococcota bacterium]|nr:hypothetical protein [Myxococcota bacterium]